MTGTSQVVKVRAKVASRPTIGSISNTASVSSTTADPNSLNNSGTEGTTVNLRPTSTLVTCSPSSVPINSPTTCKATVTDTNSDKHIADIRIESPQLEAITLETSSPRMFVNDTANSRVLVIDREKRAIVETWPITAGQKNSPMALDGANHRLLVVTRTPPRLVVLDSTGGKQVASLPSATGADDMFLDPARKRIYVATRAGVVFVYGQTDADNYQVLAEVPTSPGGKTAIFVPELSRLYVAICKAEGSKVGSKMASVKVFDVK